MIKFFHKHIRKLTTIIVVLFFATSLWQLAAAGWIQGKAVLAQQLLNHSWKQTLNDTKKHQTGNALHKPIIHKPWFWADTWPVAKLLVPQYNIEQIVLAGDSGNSLAFGPGHSFASAGPNTNGLVMISGHRDTHFRFLKDLKAGDSIYIQTPEKTILYQVYDFQIVDSKTFTLAANEDEKTLVLVTCYPFNAINTGGPLRYLVYAATQ